MTSPYISEAVERAKLPISVWCEEDIPGWWIGTPDFFVLPEGDAASAARTYRRLCTLFQYADRASSPLAQPPTADAGAPVMSPIPLGA